MDFSVAGQGLSSYRPRCSVAGTILVPWPGFELASPTLGGGFLNHGTTREVPAICLYEQRPGGVARQETFRAGRVTGRRNGGRDSSALCSAGECLTPSSALLCCPRPQLWQVRWVWESLPSFLSPLGFSSLALTWNIWSISDFRIYLYYLILKLFLILF